jgi:hypothetical protein
MTIKSITPILIKPVQPNCRWVTHRQNQQNKRGRAKQLRSPMIEYVIINKNEVNVNFETGKLTDLQALKMAVAILKREVVRRERDHSSHTDKGFHN